MTDSPARFVGKADERVHVEVDGAGQVQHIQLSDDAMRMTAAELAGALTAALRQAQDAARASVDQVTASYGALPSRERLEAAAAEASETANRRFAEISSALYGLERRAEQTW